MSFILVSNRKYYYYLEVKFLDSESDKTYYYISNDVSIGKDDHVAVEVDGQLKECIVISGYIYDEKYVPRPVNETKCIKSIIITADNYFKSKNKYLDVNELYMRQRSVEYYVSEEFESKNRTDYRLEQFINKSILDKKHISFGREFLNLKCDGTQSEQITQLLKFEKLPVSLYVPDGYESFLYKGFYSRNDKWGETYYGKENIKEVYVPKSYKQVRFQGHSSINKLVLSNGIEELCLSGSGMIRELYIPKTVKHIDVIPKNTLHIFLDKDNPYVFFANDILYIQSPEDRSPRRLWSVDINFELK